VEFNAAATEAWVCFKASTDNQVPSNAPMSAAMIIFRRVFGSFKGVNQPSKFPAASPQKVSPAMATVCRMKVASRLGTSCTPILVRIMPADSNNTNNIPNPIPAFHCTGVLLSGALSHSTMATPIMVSPSPVAASKLIRSPNIKMAASAVTTGINEPINKVTLGPRRIKVAK